MEESRNRESIEPSNIFWNTSNVLSETVDCMHCALSYLNNINLNKPQSLLLKLCLERIITNLHQLINIYKKHTGFTLSPEEQKSFEKISRIRQALVHSNTDIEFIVREMNNRGSYNRVGPNMPNAMKIGDIVLGNNFTDDLKVFYGQSFVLVNRHLIRLTCKIVDHYNFYDSFPKIELGIDTNKLYALTNDEPLIDENAS